MCTNTKRPTDHSAGFYRVRDIDKLKVFAGSFFCTTAHLNAEYLTGIEKGKGKHVVWYNLAYVVCHYAEQQGVLIYYCGQWSIKSWRCAEREQIPFFIPTLPTSLHHFLVLPFCASFRPCWHCKNCIYFIGYLLTIESVDFRTCWQIQCWYQHHWI